MNITFISDTHTYLEAICKKLVAGDMLIHCGDALNYGTMPEFGRFARTFGDLKKRFKYLLYIPGNHDKIVEKEPGICREILRENGVQMLLHEEATIEGIRFFGSPYTPNFYDWAFMPERGEQMAYKWQSIPDGTDVLITHGPPHGILDLSGYVIGEGDAHVGCEELLKVVTHVQPKVHAFGHIHHDYGVLEKTWSNGQTTTFINCAICDEQYMPKRAPITIKV